MMKLWQLFRRKQQLTVLSQLMSARDDRSSLAGTTGITDGYLSNGIVYRAIGMIARTTASIPVGLYRHAGDQIEEIVDPENPYLRLLRHPMPASRATYRRPMRWAEWAERFITCLYCLGYAAVRKLSAAPNKPPIELELISPERRLRHAGRSPAEGWMIDANEHIPHEDLLILSFWHPGQEGDLSAVSPIRVARYSINLSNAARVWNANLLWNDGRPGGILKSKSNIILSDEEIERLKNEFRQGARKAGEPIVQLGDFDFTPTSFPPKDIDWVQGVVYADRLTAFTLGVPSQLLGDKDAATYSNMQEARRALYTETIIPLINWILSSLSAFVFVDDNEYYYDYDADALAPIQEDLNTKWDKIESASELSVNEKRAARGYSELEGEGGNLIVLKNGIVLNGNGDIVYVPTTLIESQGGTEFMPTPENAKAASLPAIDFLASDDEKARRHWHAVEIERRKLERHVSPIIRRALAAESKLAQKYVREARTVDPENVVHGISSELDQIWKPAMRELYRRVADTVAPRFAEGFRPRAKAAAPRVAGEIELYERIRDKWEEIIGDYLETESAEKVTYITETTRNRLREILKQIELDGLGADEAAKRIDRLYLAEIIPHRSEVIARTEIVSAANLTSHGLAREAGMRVKRWVATADTRTRDDHRALHGHTVPLDGTFRFPSGGEVMFPGDRQLGAPPEQTIQCRCTLVYATE